MKPSICLYDIQWLLNDCYPFNLISDRGSLGGDRRGGTTRQLYQARFIPRQRERDSKSVAHWVNPTLHVLQPHRDDLGAQRRPVRFFFACAGTAGQQMSLEVPGGWG